MKKLILAVAMMASAEAAIADTAAHGVRTSDLHLTTNPTPALVRRILDRMYAICGSPNQAQLAQTTGFANREDREACKASLRVNDARPEVQAAFNAALAKFR